MGFRSGGPHLGHELTVFFLPELDTELNPDKFTIFNPLHITLNPPVARSGQNMPGLLVDQLRLEFVF